MTIESLREEDLSDLSIILVSPNVSERMGGEAIKALQIYLSLVRCGAQVHQITHERVRGEIEKKWPAIKVSYVKDTWLQKMAFRLGQLNPVLELISGTIITLAFQREAARIVRGLVKTQAHSLVHFTTPISPVVPHFAIRGTKVVIGPLNGNIYYPPTFRYREPVSDTLRRWLHPGLQKFQRVFFRGKCCATLLVAGGARTRKSLRLAGCHERQLVETLDSGVSNQLILRERIQHSADNFHFVHVGRLVSVKGTDLAIRSLMRTNRYAQLDVIGSGPELNNLKRLVEELELKDRVRFLDWVPNEQLAQALKRYRALVFPSLAEANGIVVQEAMVIGLPVIALNWGGPSLLVTSETGILIDPRSEQYVIEQLAMAMDRLGEDGALAERLSVAGRERATTNGFMWSSLVQQWASIYRHVLMDRDAVAPS